MLKKLKEKWYRQGREDGFDLGQRVGYEDGYRDGVEYTMPSDAIYTAGYDKGYEDGFADGEDCATRNDLLVRVDPATLEGVPSETCYWMGYYAGRSDILKNLREGGELNVDGEES